jgi:hydroxymethylbilane synthase
LPLMTPLRIGTRGSELALFQANAVASLLRETSGTPSEIVVIKTSGDRLAEASLSEIGGKRLFVKEIEEALLEDHVDLAVHSSKDMPVSLPDGLAIGAVLPREDARDAVVLKAGLVGTDSQTVDSLTRLLGREPRIGTSSVRRIAQLSRLWPSARFAPIRGNLNTRLRKLDTGEYDALVLASAGLLRLRQGDRITASLPTDACVPAPGQGIIAVEIRANDDVTARFIDSINDRTAAVALAAERAVIVELGGGCQMPIGAHAAISEATLRMHAVVVSLDGTRAAHASGEGSIDDPEALGRLVAQKLRDDGAGEILADVLRAHAHVEGLQP